eukprot:gene179-792_t
MEGCFDSVIYNYTRLFLFAVLLVAVVSGQHGKCTVVKIPQCKEWNHTYIPNDFLGIDTQTDAQTRVDEFKPLYQVNCAPMLKLFICSMSVPFCFVKDGVPTPVYACRSMCEAARKGCEPVMKKHNFNWPELLRCDRLPEDKKEVCIPAPKPRKPVKKRPTTVTPSVEDIRSRLARQNISMKTVCSYRKDFVYVDDGEQQECAPRCNASILYQKKQKNFISAWITIWSSICFLSTLLTITTFLIDSRRFTYPERPIIFLSMCYNIYSVGYLVRVFAGREAVVCQSSSNGKYLISDGMSNTACTIVFFLLYFFGMASAIWWVILALTWFLSAALKWGTEAVEKYSSIFHAIAWTVPTIQTIVALVTRKVDADELSGLCFIGTSNSQTLLLFVVVPLFIYLLLGSSFLLAGFISLIRIRRALQLKETNTQKLEKLMVRIGVFSLLYSIPASFVVGCFWHEYERLKIVEKYSPHLVVCQLIPGCRQAQNPGSAIMYMKYFMLLVVGVTSGVWIWSSKTLESWRNCYRKCLGKGYDVQLKPAKKTTSEMNHNRHKPQGSQPQEMQNMRQYVPAVTNENLYTGVGQPVAHPQPIATMNPALSSVQFVTSQHPMAPPHYISTQAPGSMIPHQISPMAQSMTLQQTVPFYTMPVMAHSIVSQPNSEPMKSGPKHVTPRGSTSASHCNSIRTTDSDRYGSGGSHV